ncbi:MAG: hypothetical protein NUV92_08410 [Ignavibacteria bacterium]|jgi:hypothetical protein|nr:hypothetical protein [Ignavibacteria bacterium]MDH7527229.1 hypothetical protein [Ignavibacteria bacterium]
MKKSIFSIDFLEQRIVFSVSRTFFWIFVIAAGLSFVAAILVLIYSIIPPSKTKVIKEEYPPKPNISIEEVVMAITPIEEPPVQPRPVEKRETKETSSGEEYVEQIPPIDPIQKKIDLLLDSIGTYIRYGWNDYYDNVLLYTDWFGRPVYQTRKVSGMRNDLIKFLDKHYQSQDDKIKQLEFIIELLQKIDEKLRDKALKYYIRTLKERWNDYDNRIRAIDLEYQAKLDKAEADYQQAKFEKKNLSNMSLLSILSSIVTVALIGLILTQLAIERNTRSLKELLEKNIQGQKNE